MTRVYLDAWPEVTIVNEPLDSGKAQVAATYNAASEHFDDSPLAFWDKYGRRTIERLSLAAGSSVLDVGCGSGASALPAAEAVGPSGQVIGVDLAEKLLNLGRAKAVERGLHNVEFRVGDMTDLGFADSRFDAVVSVFSIFFVEDMEEQVAELWRIVCPGGRLAITTWGPRLFEPAESAWWEAVKRERPDLYSTDKPWNRFIDSDSLRQLLVDGGVPDAEVIAEEGRHLFERPEDWWMVVLGSGYRGTMEKMTSEAAERVRKENIRWAKETALTSIETNVIYAVATKYKP